MEDIIKKIYDYSLEDIMGQSFGRYSKYIIQDRAIPDVRDGLKPVQRRILYSMYKERNTYDKPTKKSANAVGLVMANYHPHGDSSIYEAIVRMSQWWKNEAPLIEMQGNNGSIDGDSPAASRYTEARLSKIAGELLRDIDKTGIVPMAPNYDDRLLEPTVLPSRFPNLLVNGTTGISAGYATNMPPHNLGEVIDATVFRIDNPNSRLDTVMNYIKGPDFPTGGIALGIDGIKKAYETGRGKIFIRAKTKIEKNKIIIDEIPYEVNKQLLVKRMDEIRIDKKIDGIVEVRDESDKDGLQIAVELKKDADANNILNYFYKNTDLQVSYNFNNVVIVNRRPMQLGLLGILDAYIAHQKEIVYKGTEYDLKTAKASYHIMEGLVKAISILDEVIALIRRSKNKADAIVNLVKEYDFTDKQAEAIVNLQLYRLTNTDVVLLEEEMKKLEEKIKLYEEILTNPDKLNSVIKEDLRKIKKEYGIPRRTEIREELEEINNSYEILTILREYGIIDTYDTEEEAEEIPEEVSEEIPEEDAPKEEVLEDIVNDTIDPYRIKEVIDYPKTLNIGLAKLKGESVRETVNRKLNPKPKINLFDELTKDMKPEEKVEETPSTNESVKEEPKQPVKEDIVPETNNITPEPIWTMPTEEIEPVKESKEENPVWTIPVVEQAKEEPIKDEEINKINLENTNNMFWIPVSDSKLETKDFPNINIPINNKNFSNTKDNFGFPDLE